MRAALLVATVATLGATRVARAQVGHLKDNSFLIEEAYNQEAGVVQHITAFARSARTRDWLLAFTQEWPIGGERHQLSYTVNLDRVGGPAESHTALGDLAVHYRIQALGRSESDRVFLAPRLSTTLPTGAARRGHGTGGVGLELALPLSIGLSRRLAAHANARAAVVTGAGGRGIDEVPTWALGFGASLVWAATRSVHLLMETVVDQSRLVTATGGRRSETTWVVNPGIRWGLDLPGALQIVPGVAYTVDLRGAEGDQGVFLYLSVEHPFIWGRP